MKRILVLLLCITPISVTEIFAEDSSKIPSTTQKMLKPLIELQCESELKSSKLWQASTFFMSSTQQSAKQKQICACVGEHALDQVPTKDLFMAMVNESAKNKLVQQAVMNSLKGCAQEAIK